MDDRNSLEKTDDVFWRHAFFSDRAPVKPLHRLKHDITRQRNEKIGDSGELWLTQLFNGTSPLNDTGDKLTVYKNGGVIHEIQLDRLGKETVIGRHPDADLQLEAQNLAMFHVAIVQRGGSFYLENLDNAIGILFNRKRIKQSTPLKLFDGVKVDLPGYRLEFSMPAVSAKDSGQAIDDEAIEDIPEFFYTPPPPPSSPLLVNPLQEISPLSVWCEGTVELRVADIIEETRNAKTFRLVGKEPLLFAYQPGQFITFILNIDGREVRRSYSLSSSPSRPYLLEITIKRIRGGFVSNWFCDQVKLGDLLTATGPAGKFSCFNFPSNKMLFISAGSGITPIISMCRWIIDTGSDVDVKLLASFKTPADIMFRKELEMLAERYSAFKVALTVTADTRDKVPWQGLTGRIDEAMLKSLVPDILDRHVFMCGPELFTDQVKKMLRDMSYDMSCFHSESFGTGRAALDAGSQGQTLQLKGTRHQVTFAKSGLTVETDEHINLLALAEAYGIELDYSCRAGSCGECEVKCEGRVTMSDECEIDDKTRNAGFIYACCSTAKTDLILDA